MTTTIPSFPVIPHRLMSESDFANAGDDLLGRFPAFVTALNVFGQEIEGVSEIAQKARDEAAGSASAAASSVMAAGEQVMLATEQKTLAADSASAADASRLAAQAAAAAAGAAAGLPSLTGKGKNVLKVKTDESGVEWGVSGISSILPITSNTVLTSTPTYVVATPSDHGVTVTLPDATTCQLGGPAYAVENRSDTYAIAVLDSTLKLIGYVVPGTVSSVFLKDNGTASGVWRLDNGFDTGITLNIPTNPGETMTLHDSLALDATRELLTFGSTTALYACVYDSATRTHGEVTAVRMGVISSINLSCATVLDSTRVLVVSCTSVTTAMEGVILSIDGTSITVNTAGTKTLSSTFNNFTNYATFRSNAISVGPGGIAIAYTRASGINAVQVVVVSDTTVSFGAELAVTGTASNGHAIFPTPLGFIAFSHSGASTIYSRHYTITGSSLSAGTELNTAAGVTINSMFPFASGSRWMVVVSDDGTTGVRGFVMSLSGTTVSASTRVDIIAAQSAAWLTRVGERVGVFSSGGRFNTLTDSEGVAVAGAVVSIAGGGALVRVDGTTAYIWRGANTVNNYLYAIDCSTTSNASSYTVATSVVDMSSVFQTVTTGVAPSTLVAGNKGVSAYAVNTKMYQDRVVGEKAVIQLNPLFSKHDRVGPLIKSALTTAAGWGKGGGYVCRYELAED